MGKHIFVFGKYFYGQMFFDVSTTTARKLCTILRQHKLE